MNSHNSSYLCFETLLATTNILNIKVMSKVVKIGPGYLNFIESHHLQTSAGGVNLHCLSIRQLGEL